MSALVALLALSLPALAASPRQAKKAEKLALQAEQAIDEGDIWQAYKKSTKAIEKDDQNARAYRARGMALIVAAQEPENDLAGEMLGESLIMFQRCAALEGPGGGCEGLAAQLAGALSGAASRIPEPEFSCSAEAHASLDAAESAFHARELEVAAGHYQKAVDLCPAAVPWYTWYGDVYFQLDKFEEAIGLYNLSLELDPCYWPAHRFTADVRFRQGMLEDAQSAAAKAVACNPDYTLGWNTLGAIADQRGRRLTRVVVEKPVVNAGQDGAQIMLSGDAFAAPGFGGGVGLLYALSLASAEDGLSPLQAERHAVRQTLLFVAEAEDLPPETRAFWQVMANAEADGYLDEAIFLLLLDDKLLPEYLAYRETNRQRLVDFVQKHLVVE